MPISKNWEAIAFSGAAGNEIKVEGDVSDGPRDVVPHLRKRTPQGGLETILQLDLINAGDEYQENFKHVQYNEKIGEISTYTHVEIFHNNDWIEGVPVQIIGT